MLITVALLVVIVQIFQEGGLKLVTKLDRRAR
jgi:ABC-type methionine transport system permease subunit